MAELEVNPTARLEKKTKLAGLTATSTTRTLGRNQSISQSVSILTGTVKQVICSGAC